MNWYWIGVAATVPLALGFLIAWPMWRRGLTTFGSSAGAGVIFMAGLFAALWKLGILERLGTTWTLIGVVIAIGIGIMMAVTGSGEKKTIEVDRS